MKKIGKQEFNSNWAIYYGSLDNLPKSVAIDLGLAYVAPVAQFPYLTRIELIMEKVDEYGQPLSEELDIVNPIEDKLADDILKNFIYAGRITSNKKRVYFFYSQYSISKTNNENLDKIVIREISFQTEKDPEWSAYLNELYPDDQTIQILSNQSVLRDLQSHGDDLSRPREVDHCIFFNNKTNLNRFLEKAINAGYTLIDISGVEDKENYYRLEIKRMEMVDEDHIHKTVFALIELASEFQGNYDGWACAIMPS